MVLRSRTEPGQVATLFLKSRQKAGTKMLGSVIYLAKVVTAVFAVVTALWFPDVALASVHSLSTLPTWGKIAATTLPVMWVLWNLDMFG